MKFRIKLLALIFGALMLVNAAYAESPREQLKQMVGQLQKSPADNALREQIIKLAQELKPAPAVPEEARRHFVKAVTLQKDAKNPEDYDLPIQEYRQVLLLAPWWSDAYFDLASALELKQQYAEAIQNLKLSILASPEGPDARAAQDKVYALEAKSEKANSYENSPAGKLDKFYKSLDGGVWKAKSFSDSDSLNGGREREWPERLIETENQDLIKINGDELTGWAGNKCILNSRECEVRQSENKYKWTISEDGQFILFDWYVESMVHGEMYRRHQKRNYQRIK